MHAIESVPHTETENGGLKVILKQGFRSLIIIFFYEEEFSRFQFEEEHS